MIVQRGSLERPVRVAIVGAGPSGFYAAGALLAKQKKSGLVVAVDLFDKLIAPHGLVRYGVAPDHQNIKAVAKVYDKTAATFYFRYFGQVEYCKDLHLEDLQQHYDAIIFAVGAQADRQLGIPGEGLPNSFSATEFVAWYNSHPQYASFNPDLDVESAVVVGVGNVAMDVARVLARTIEELKTTDIADHALTVLAQSKIKDIYVLSRRGPAQVKFTPIEIKEFAHLAVAEPVVLASEMLLDAQSARLVADDAEMQRNLATLRNYAQSPSTDKERRVHFRFLLSPVEIIANEADTIIAVKCEKNRLVLNSDGNDMKAIGTGEFETIPAGMVLRSVGYKGTPLGNIPYDRQNGTIPNREGRVIDEQGQVLAGLYVVGWAKRGPTGVIGTNKPDAIETVEKLIEDLPNLAHAPTPSPEAIIELLDARQVRFVKQDEWYKINQTEVARGAEQGRPRVKIVLPQEMLALLDES